jgi:hypothetical protein
MPLTYAAQNPPRQPSYPELFLARSINGIGNDNDVTNEEDLAERISTLTTASEPVY